MKKVWKKTCAAVCSAAMALSATSVAFAAEDAEQELRMQYGNALDIYANPTEDLYGDYSTNKYNNFSDMGAWHGYYLPEEDEIDIQGGFAGPVIVAEEYPVNLSGAFSKLEITKADGTVYSYEDAKASGVYYPGKLVQTYDFEDITVNMELIFGSDRTALIKTEIVNKTEEPVELKLKWNGDM